MTRLHRMILRMLPGPFVGWLTLLMFLLLMQFLIKYLPDLVGKGLPLTAIMELVVYNLAYMVVLAVPMSVLISTLMTYGRLAETNAYAVVKSAGVSVMQLVWPMLVLGAFLAGLMMYFNAEVLPEANFRAKALWMDIRKKKPGFELKPGVFYDGIANYSIMVREIPPTERDAELVDVTIYDYTDGTKERVDIKAARGRIEALAGGTQLDLVLEDGEVHRLISTSGTSIGDRYERLAFSRHRLRLNLEDIVFERSNPRESYRSDRTMRTRDMLAYIDSLDLRVAQERARLAQVDQRLLAPPKRSAARPARADARTQQYQQYAELAPTAADATTDSLLVARMPPRVALAGLSGYDRRRAFDFALQRVRTARAQVDNLQRTVGWEVQRADRYRVEVHKKFSIAMACLIFMLIGAPLGLSIRRGGLGTAGALAIGIFLFYWITLVQGEKLADRGFLEPWVGMWVANLLALLIGTYLMLYVLLDLRATPALRHRLWRRKPSSAPPTS